MNSEKRDENYSYTILGIGDPGEFVIKNISATFGDKALFSYHTCKKYSDFRLKDIDCTKQTKALFLVLRLGDGSFVDFISEIESFRKKTGIPVYTIMSYPFLWEGPVRISLADELLQDLIRISDATFRIESHQWFPLKAELGFHKVVELVHQVAVLVLLSIIELETQDRDIKTAEYISIDENVEAQQKQEGVWIVKLSDQIYKKAMNSLAEKLDLPADKSFQQWSSELLDGKQLKKVLFLYDSLYDEDEKFILMGIMVQAANDQFEAIGKCDSWERIEQRLVWDFNIHKKTIFHWTCPDNDMLDLNQVITPDMRELWSMSKVSKKRVLFVCTINLMRSATAHKIFLNDLRLEVKSAGTHRSAETVLSRELLDWSESLVVMEERHLNFIKKMYPEIAKNKRIVCLDVPDNYDYLDPELIALLRERIEEGITRGII